MSHPHRHETHPALIKRLRRAHGHLQSVIDMIEHGRDCLDIAQQLQAVEKAISQAKKTLVQDHIDHCLEHAISGARGSAASAATLDEFKQITRYL
ncbi:MULTISPECIES: metal-sensing transcriptional repressor [Hydrogenophaga]|jgi:DNA-binding FrmR family transcriptional regulator|nr:MULTISPECIES: metal-sensing transcriptional repressor [Hydrogenophaga]AOS81710.1 nickel resistance protein [Hydrogenophaga sp. PBC]TMU71777.1 metal-sensing transcriptional repressor [Hydrogenophaga intermedia]